MTQVLELRRLRLLVQSHPGLSGVLVFTLAAAVVAFDGLVGFGGPHLIGLRLAYLAVMLLVVAYVRLTSVTGP